jgi:acetyl esterase/lipase
MASFAAAVPPSTSSSCDPKPTSKLVRQDLRLDVSAAAPRAVSGSKRQWLGARIIAPSVIDYNRTAPVVICVHGGTYDKRYFDLDVPNRDGYSMAAHFAARGAIVVALDYLGISDSSRPPHMELADRHVFAAVQDAAARQVFDRLAKGELAPQLPALPRIRRVGLAHSMGVMLTITQQAAHATYDQVALLGYSVRGVQLVRAGAAPPPLTKASEADARRYLQMQRERLRAEYYMPDVPKDVIDADDAAAALPPRAISQQAQTAGIVIEDAGKIAAPVFFALGEHDISPAPHEETGYFKASDDVSLLILKGSAHSHNLAGSRQILWDRILAWSAAAGLEQG